MHALGLLLGLADGFAWLQPSHGSLIKTHRTAIDHHQWDNTGRVVHAQCTRSACSFDLLRMSLEDIEHAIEFVAELSTRNVLCNCALCYPNACSLVERAVNKNKWVAFLTSTSHATNYPRAAHEYPVEPLVHNPDPTPQLRFSHSQVLKGLESARIQALAAPQQATSSSSAEPSAPESPASTNAGEAGPSSPSSPPPPSSPPVPARTQPYLAPQCLFNE